MRKLASRLSATKYEASRVYLVAQAQEQQLQQAAAEYLQKKRAADRPLAGECLISRLDLWTIQGMLAMIAFMAAGSLKMTNVHATTCFAA